MKSKKQPASKPQVDMDTMKPPLSIHAIRYGGPGSGKTLMVASWPQALPKKDGNGKRPWVLVLDFDNGLNTIRNTKGQLPEGILGLPLRDTLQEEDIKPTRMQRQSRAYQRAVELMNAIMKAPSPSSSPPEEYVEAVEEWADNPWADRIATALPGYDPSILTPRPWVVVIDTLTGLHDAAMNLALSLDTQKVGLGGGPAMHHWGAQMRYVDEFLKLCESQDWHTDVTCHEALEKDEISGAMVGTILVTGKKTAGLIPGLYDEMYHHELDRMGEKTAYVLRTQSNGFFAAKSRLGFDVGSGEYKLEEIEDVTRTPDQDSWGWGKIISKLLS